MTQRGARTRARMVDAAGRLLESQGYSGTGVKQILDESGAPRGSFYFHFPGGKEELACAALEHAGEAWRLRIEEVIAQASDPAAAVVAVCDALAESLAASGYTTGCPLATVALEAAATVDAIHGVCSAHYARWQGVIADLLVAAGAPRGTSQATAALVLAAIEGALLLCRAHRSAEPMRQVGASLARAVATLAPGRTDSRPDGGRQRR